MLPAFLKKPRRVLLLLTTLGLLLFTSLIFQRRLSAFAFLSKGYILAPFTPLTILGQSSTSCPIPSPLAYNETTTPNPETQPELFAASFDLTNLTPPTGAKQVVPRIIHQVRLGGLAMRPKWEKARAGCMELMPPGEPSEGGWRYELWDDVTGDAFVKEHYPELFKTYRGYKQEIQRSNILRYLLLHHFGGIYLDLDLLCRKPLDAFLTVPFVSPPANPAGVNNAFIAARPGHEFFTDLITHMIPYDMAWFGSPYVSNMMSTGCHFFSSFHLASPFHPSLYVLPNDYKLNGHVVTPIFEHLGASSWHKGDAKAILALGKGIEVLKKVKAKKVAKWVGIVGVVVVGWAVWVKYYKGEKKTSDEREVEEGRGKQDTEVREK